MKPATAVGGDMLGEAVAQQPQHHEGEHLARAAERAGLDLAELDRAIAAEPGRYEAALADNDAALRAAGHWGVPTAVFRGEPFFGQDRLDTLVWRLRQHGLEPRR